MAGDILIVEDDPDMAEALRRALSFVGHAARIAPNGAIALEAVEARVPALILLDMLMPVMDGWEFARALHAKYGRTIPIVVITAAEDARLRSAAIGANAVLAKPFDLADLLELVERYIGGVR